MNTRDIDLAELIASCVPADLRAECAGSFNRGREEARARGDMRAPGERLPEHAIPAFTPIPIHPETPPQWYRNERAALARGDRRPANRNERRALEAAQRIADGRVEEVQRDAYRARMRAHQRAHAKRWRYVQTRPSADPRLEAPRPATAQQFIATKAAISDEWGCRATVAAMPAPIALALSEWIEGLGASHAYGSPWSSRLARRTVATLAAVLYASRPSWRDGYALVTTGMGRERIAAIIGDAPESGRPYAVSSLSHHEYGSIPILAALGCMERTQLPGDAVPGCDRGYSFAFNHYLIPHLMVSAGDQWGDPSRINPSLPPELAALIAPWTAAPEGELLRLAEVRACALTTALDRDAQEHAAQEHAEHEAAPVDPSRINVADPDTPPR
jgi:hypothetical protein